VTLEEHENMQAKARSMMAALLLSGCGDDMEVDEAGARSLWDKIHAEHYENWQRAPGYDQPQPTVRAHGQTAVVFVNPTVGQALSGPALDAWPVGSLVVKDSFSGAQRTLVAAMEKQPGGWYFAEWSASGEAKYAGRPDVCTGCHTSNNDFLRAIVLPGR
jgi:hypothetical protein